MSNNERSYDFVLNKSSIDPSTGYTEEVITVEVSHTVSENVKEIGTAIVSELDSSSNDEANSVSSSLSLHKESIVTESWSGKVLAVKESSFIARLFSYSDSKKKLMVEIDETFEGIDIKSFKRGTHFTLIQFKEGEEWKASIRIEEDHMTQNVRDRIVESKMRKYSYMFGEDGKA